MTYRLPESLTTPDSARAVSYLQRYFGTAGEDPYGGSYYDDWAQPQDPDRFTADDLVAVSFLSVFVPPSAARRLLASESRRFTELLHDVGPDRDLVDEDRPIDATHPIRRLNRALDDLPGVGPTIASKLLARKRPRLVPIYDSVVARVTDAWTSQWEPLRLELRKDGLHTRLIDLRERAGLEPNVSALRVYDVITWMEGKDNHFEPETAEERLGAELADTGEDT
jgi:hypothetical protein